MVEPCKLPAHRVDAGDVRPLVSVTVRAGLGEVLGLGRPAVLVSNDVVDGEGEFRSDPR